jgi:Carboxypeptidase regulatory-like domain
MANKDSAIKVALIGAAALIAAAIVGAILQPSWWRSDSSTAPRTSLTVAGRVVDFRTNLGIGQASVSIVGRSETDVTEDNGNFRINLQPPAPKDGTVRVHVVKTGYAPGDETTTPTETLIVQLRQM